MRTVRVSIVNTRSLQNETKDVILSRAKERIKDVSRDRPDLILLSELFANFPKEETRKAVTEAAQDVPGPITEELSGGLPAGTGRISPLVYYGAAMAIFSTA